MTVSATPAAAAIGTSRCLRAAAHGERVVAACATANTVLVLDAGRWLRGSLLLAHDSIWTASADRGTLHRLCQAT